MKLQECKAVCSDGDGTCVVFNPPGSGVVLFVDNRDFLVEGEWFVYPNPEVCWWEIGDEKKPSLTSLPIEN